MTYSRSLKFNPYHDKLGRFTTADNAVRTSAWQADYMDYTDNQRKIIREHNKSQKAYMANGGTPGTRYDIAQKGERLPLGDLMGALAIFGAHQRMVAERNKFLYGGMEEFVLAEGREHNPPDAPPRIALGEVKQCYKNAADFVMQASWSGEEPDRYKYVEGYYMDPRIPIPIEHAYVLDTQTDTVIDPTFGWAPTARYIGVEFTYRDMAKHLSKNKYYGLFSNGIGPNPIVLGNDPDFSYTAKKEDTAMYRQVLKFNPNHYPAGASGGKGGQFAPSKNKGGGKDVVDALPAGELIVNQRAQAATKFHIDPENMNDAIELALRWSGNMKDVTETISEEEYRDRKARYEAALQKQKDTEGIESWRDHYTNDTPPENPDFMRRSGFSEERRALHDEIFTKMMRTGWTTKHADGTETFHRPALDYQVKDGAPTVLHLGGRAGAGKSFLGKDGGVYARDKFFVVDPDEIKMMLPEYDRETTNIVHEESSYLAKRIMEACRRLGCNFVSDKTMGKVKSIRRDVDHVAISPKGYHQEAHIITVPRVISMMRAVKRWNEGGRLVPPGVIWSMTGMEDAADYVVSSETRIEKVTIWNGFTESGKAELHFERGPLVVKSEWWGKVMKFNPYHDRLGRFTTAFNATYVSAWGKAYMEKFKDSELRSGILSAFGKNSSNFESAQLSTMLARAYGASDSEIRSAAADLSERMRSQLGIPQIAETYTGHDDRKWRMMAIEKGGLPPAHFDMETMADRRDQLAIDSEAGTMVDPVQIAFKKHHSTYLSDALTDSQRAAIDAYSGSAYGPLNKTASFYTDAILKGGEEVKAAGYELFRYADQWISTGPPTDQDFRQVLSAADQFDTILRGQTLGEDIVLRRNMPDAYLLRQLGLSDYTPFSDILKNKKNFIGKTYVETAGAMSCSTNLGLTLKMSNTGATTILRIRAPKEAKGVYIASHSSTPDEKEVLLPRGSTFVIRDIQHKSDIWGSKNLVIDLDLVSQPYLSFDPIVEEAQRVRSQRYPNYPATKAEKEDQEFQIITPACKSCRWRSEDQATCKAYPKGIPAPILLGMFRHKYPLYGFLGPTDHGISYAPIDKQIKH